MEILGSNADEGWTRLIRRPPVAIILAHVHSKWQEYVATYGGIGVPLAQRDEPTLTQGLAAFLRSEAADGRQNFDGEFLAEIRRYDLAGDGRAIVLGRTDIEWCLFGFPSFVLEFKILGGGRQTTRYFTDGIARFLDGRYARDASEASMCGLVLPDATRVIAEIENYIDTQAANLRCVAIDGRARCVPSRLAPAHASFDSIHTRAHPWPTIHLVHFFIYL